MATTTEQLDPRTIGPVTAGATLGGSAATVLAWILGTWLNVEMPAAVIAAVAVIFTAAGTLLGGYLVRPAPRHATEDPAGNDG